MLKFKVDDIVYHYADSKTKYKVVRVCETGRHYDLHQINGDLNVDFKVVNAIEDELIKIG